MMVEKTAGILVYLLEELTDARLRCEQLKGYVDQAMRLVSSSSQKSHIYEVAGNLLYALPDALFRLDKALDATALAASRLDYEELKQELRPEKVEELESVLKDVRIRRFDRRAPQVPEEMTMRKLATGSDVAAALRHIANVIETEERGGKQPSTSKISQALQAVIGAMNPSADEARRSRFEEGKPADPTENMDGDDAKKWKVEHDKNKDKFKSANTVVNNAISFTTSTPPITFTNCTFRSAGDEEHRSKFEEGKPADPTENMSEEDAKKWKIEHLKNKDQFKAADFDTRDPNAPFSLDGSFESIRMHAILAFKRATTAKNYRWAIQELAWVSTEIASLMGALQLEGSHYAGQLALALTRGKNDVRIDALPPGVITTARFEAGKPADPTQNMTADDASKWKAMNEEYGDQFKTAGAQEGATLMRLRKGDKVKITAKGLPKPRVLDVLANPQKLASGNWMVSVTSGRPWGRNPRGGVLQYSETPIYGRAPDEVSYQATLSQSPVLVTALEVISDQEAERLLMAHEVEEG